MAHRFITAADVKARWGAAVDQLAGIVAGGPTGAAAAIDGAIDGAEAEVLSYLLPRYRNASGGGDGLPTDPAQSPTVLRDLLADVAMYHLARPAGRIGDPIQRAYDRAIGLAKVIARGQADIGLSDAPAADQSTSDVLANKTVASMIFGNGGLDQW